MPADRIHHRGLTLDVSGYKLIGCGRSEYLTRQQTRLLALLMAEPAKVHSFQALANALPDSDGLSDEAVKVSISRIRRSLRLLGCTLDYLLSVRGIGYIFDPAVPRESERASSVPDPEMARQYPRCEP